MLNKIIYFSIKNKLIIGLLTIALVIWGCWSITRLPIDAVPDITNNQVQVITTSPSLAAQEVERLITYPIEISVVNIPGITEVRSISRFGLSVVTIVFTEETDVYWARQQVTERLKAAAEQIPKGAGHPELAPVTTGLGEIYQYILTPEKGYENKYSPMELRTIQDWVVRRQLLGTEGIADVSSFGGYVKQYEVAINPEKLRSMNLTIGEVFTALETNNQNAGGAYIDKKPNAYFIRTEGLACGLEDIKKIVVKNTDNGTPILIKDVGMVQFGHAIRYGAMTINNKGEAVGGIVLMLKGANSHKVIKDVKKRIEEITALLPKGVKIEAFLDRTKLVDHAIHTVVKNLIEGALIVIFILVIMLGNFRAGLVVASVIPLAMLFAICMMSVFNVSGNLMSLGAIDFGIIVDGAVIIVEATLHYIVDRTSSRDRLSQEDMDTKVFNAASKIRSSVVFGEIIILMVYLPLLTLEGIEGKMFKPMAQTVAFAILGAFILSLTYVPMMSALCLSKKHVLKKNISDKIMEVFQTIYKPLLEFSLKRKLAIVLTSLAIFIGSLVLFFQMGGEFIPSLDEGDFAVETRVLAGSSMTETIDASLKASDVLMKKFPEVKEVVGKIGASEIPTDPMPIEACDLIIVLKDKDEWTSASTRVELANKMQEALEEIPGVTFGFQQPIQMRFNELMTGARQDVVIKIYGEDLDVLTKQAHKMGAIVSTIEGAKDLYIEKVTGLPQIVVSFDRDKIAQFGLNIEEVNRIVRTAFAGEATGLVYEEEKRFDMVVRLDKTDRKSIEDVRQIYVTTSKGHQVPLSQIATIDFKIGPYQIQRDRTKRRIIVAFNVRGRDVESIVNEIQEKVNLKLKLPSGYYVSYGGEFKNLLEAKKRLSVAVPIALALIFILLYFTFNSIKQSILIFTAIPLSAIGGILALWLRDMPFSISAGVGFIALFGVSVLNGIVLIAEFNNQKKEGLSDIYEIVRKGTEIRLRPVLITAFVASLGFLPMALSNSSGAEVQKPLATVVIGGLLTSTILTLLVLPILYIFSERVFKNMSPKTLGIFIPLFCLFVFYGTAEAQTLPKSITLEQALQIAHEQSNVIKSAQYQIEYNKALKGTATEISKTNATLMYGQYNSYYKDNNLTLTQDIPFPTVMLRQAQYYDATTRSAEYNLAMTQNELDYTIKVSYYNLQYVKARRLLLLRLDTLYSDFLNAASLRLKTGETNMLEKSTAQSQFYENRALITQVDSDIRIYETQLSTLLNSTEQLTSVETTLEKRNLALLHDSAMVTSNPALHYFKQQIEVANSSKNLEKARLLPDINVGYFNQTLYGAIDYRDESIIAANQRFQGISVGVSVPLWIKPQLSRIKANEASVNAAETSYKAYEKNLQGEYENAYQQYIKYKNSLEYYEANALPTAKVLEYNAWKNYQTGNIGYLEFSQGVNRAINIEQGYLNIVNQYNQSIIFIEYIIGNK